LWPLVTGGENPRVQLVSSWSNIGDQVNGPIQGSGQVVWNAYRTH